MKNKIRVIILIMTVMFATIGQSQSVDDQATGVNYRGHDVSLINKHGWLYNTQSDYDVYLSRYYTWVAERLNKDHPGEIGYIVPNSTTVNGYRYEIVIDSPSDHVLSTYTHERPAIARKWSAD